MRHFGRSDEMFITHLQIDSALVFHGHKSENKWYQLIPEEICYILGTKGESLSHLEVQKNHSSLGNCQAFGRLSPSKTTTNRGCTTLLVFFKNLISSLLYYLVS